MDFLTEQENFWAGNFGDDYIERNQNEKLIVNNVALFSKVLSRVRNVSSIIELGANIGLNLRAMKTLLPNVEYSAVEINQKAVDKLNETKWIEKIYTASLLNYQLDYARDFVLIKGVLIHINPDYLDKLYDLLYRSSNKYICVVEYYNPTPVEVTYRDHSQKLFKRDFAGELMNKFEDVRLVDYGFVYHKDPQFPQDDLTWFLLEK